MDKLSKTQAEKRELLAKFMGWHKYIRGGYKFASTWQNERNVDTVRLHEWKPDEDENHFRMVLEKIMEDEEMFREFSISFGGYPGDEGIRNYVEAPLPEKVDVVVAVLSDSQK